MQRQLGDAGRRCEDVAHVLRSGMHSREDLWEIRAILRSVATDLERVVRDRLIEAPQSNEARRAKASLVAMQNTLRWLEDNRYGVMRFEIHRGLEHAHQHSLQLLALLTHANSKPSRGAAWDGTERRSGADRRVRGERRNNPRTTFDRRACDRRAVQERVRVRRVAGG